ncbi:MAG: CopG family transcriptional regulator [Rhodospirillales bacterium]|nr:CopG family transcriptional regulator [Rhodospirillales bacterium]
MTERTTVRLPEDLLKRAKRKAAAEGRTLTSLITDGLQHVVSEPRRAARHSRVLPRVSKAKGGLMPGVDLGSFSNLQEADDLDRIDRMQRLK